ncbi:MAG TPA: glycosyltransferase family 2 protein [Gemmatimonadaceae bacterium]|jgi:glycosyltransferase involved in cell wall biosynthesis
MISGTDTPRVTGVPVCVLPALNAGDTVAEVVTSVRRHVGDVFVLGVDDGSTDATRSILKRTCDHVLWFDSNRGKGAALRAAFEYVADRFPRSAVITLDADGQHDPAFAPRLLEALDLADIVIGTREIGCPSVPPHRRIANRISTAATCAVTRLRLTDSQSGFRALRGEVVAAIDAHGDRYEYETDFIVRASQRGYRISEVAVPTIYGPPSHFRELADTWRVARVLWSHRAAAFRS